MTPRLNPYKAAREAMKALVSLENYVQRSGLDHALIGLVGIQPRGAPIARPAQMRSPPSSEYSRN